MLRWRVQCYIGITRFNCNRSSHVQQVHWTSLPLYSDSFIMTSSRTRAVNQLDDTYICGNYLVSTNTNEPQFIVLYWKILRIISIAVYYLFDDDLSCRRYRYQNTVRHKSPELSTYVQTTYIVLSSAHQLVTHPRPTDRQSANLYPPLRCDKEWKL